MLPRDKFDTALSVRADAIADTDELLHLRPRALAMRANLLAQKGTDPSTVEAAHRAAVKCARDQGARYFELQAITSSARWLKSQSRGAQAHSMLADIYGWFTEGFDVFALQQAKDLLAELGG